MNATTDRAHTIDRSDRYYAPTQVGKTRSKTPEGYLLCEGVVIARVCRDGEEMLYGERETKNGGGSIPMDAGPDGLLRVTRTADVLFSQETMTSLEGKSITVNHPPEWIGPKNWRKYSVGTAMNIRAGTEEQADLLLADYLITDEQAIADVEAGKKQVSLGYDAVYEQTGVGRAAQVAILGNHHALVENGRGGHRVAIGDAAMADEHKTILDKVKEALGITDATPNGGGVTINLGGLQPSAKVEDVADPLADIKASMADMAAQIKTLTDAKAAPALTTDAADVAPILAKAEILSPGIKFPTQDQGVAAADHITTCQRATLTAAYTTDAARGAIDVILAGKPATFATLDAATVDAVFNGSAALVGAQNNDGVRKPLAVTTDAATKKKAMTMDEIMERQRAHHGIKA